MNRKRWDPNSGRARLLLTQAAAGLILLVLSLVAVQGAYADPNNCIEDLTGTAYSCVAEDVSIGFLVVEEVTEPCEFVGDTATILFRADVVANSSERWDIGFFVAEDGGDARTSGACYHDYLPPPLAHDGTCSVSGTTCQKDADCPTGETCVGGYDPLSGSGPYYDGEWDVDATDVCGDLEQGVTNYYDLMPVTVTCVDADGDTQVDPISTCVSWDNNRSNGGNKPSCTSAADAVPSTNSKCKCDYVPVDIFVRETDLTVLKTGPVDDQQPGTTFDYTLLITNNGDDPSSGFTLTDDLDPLLKFISATPDICTSDPDDYGGIVSCVYNGTLNPGDSTTIVMTVMLHPDTPIDTTIPNTACVQGFEYDPIEGNNCDDETVTTPVTLAHFQSTDLGGRVRFEWSTATEAGNAGFNLYVQTPEGLDRLNDQLIASPVVSSVDVQDYRFEAFGVTGDTFFLEEVSIRTRARRHGPFALGQSFGAPVTADAINWPAIRAEHEGRAAVQVEQRIATLSSDPRIDLLVERDGLYRVTYEDLLAAGFDLAGVRSVDLAVTSLGAPVPIRVQAARLFGPGGFIEFYGQAVDTPYTHTNVYTLLLDRSLASRVALDKIRPARVPPARYYMETATVDQNNAYSFLAPNGDPWYDTLMMTYATPQSWSFDIGIDDYVSSGGPAVLSVGMWGLSEWKVNPDHHVVAAINNQPVADEFFDGLIDAPVSVELASGVLQEGANSLQLTLPGDTGADWDMVVLDSFGVTYPRAFVARDGALSFTAAGQVFRVTGLPSRDVVVYRATENGVARLARIGIGGRPGSYRATFAGTESPATYLVFAADALLAPEITAGRPEVDITSGTAEYLVISHPSFIDGLASLVASREAQGLDVRVVDVDDVYAQFGYSIFGPEAIRDYIAYAAGNMGTQYVLLVGGDTYDYLDYLGDGSMSFIPSLYASTDFYASFAPVDPLYTDLDADGVPDLAIGRFPVRTSAELDLMVGKTLTYEGKAYGGTAVFAADGGFGADSDSFAAELPDGWTVQRAYIDQMGVGSARSTLIDAINDGVALTSYVGHSGTSVWTFDGLFSGDDAAALVNEGEPTVVSQWGCWNTYYVSPSSNTMAHRFLLSGGQGAAAVLGSTTISYDFSERALGELLSLSLAEPGTSIGAALQAAKTELAASYPDLADVLLGWTILGDPALVIQP